MNAQTRTYPLRKLLTASVMCDRLYEHRFDKAAKRAWIINVMTRFPELEGIVTPDDIQKATEIYEYFENELILRKLSDSLSDRRPDGTWNHFNARLSKIFACEVVKANCEINCIASLPHSYRIAERRATMKDLREACGNNGYIGNIGRQMKIKGTLMDIRELRRTRVQHYIVFIKTVRDNIAKFIISSPHTDTLYARLDKDIGFVGTVSAHQENKYHTGCQETLFKGVTIL